MRNTFSDLTMDSRSIWDAANELCNYSVLARFTVSCGYRLEIPTNLLGAERCVGSAGSKYDSRCGRACDGNDTDYLLGSATVEAMSSLPAKLKFFRLERRAAEL